MIVSHLPFSFAIDLLEKVGQLSLDPLCLLLREVGAWRGPAETSCAGGSVDKFTASEKFFVDTDEKPYILLTQKLLF